MDFTILRENLEKMGYKVNCFDSAYDAADYLKSTIKGQSVSLGGSITAKEMKLDEILAGNNELLWHWNLPSGTTMEEMLDRAAHTDVYISSVNAIAESGEIINIDGTCNRLSSTLYGHKKVYLLIGKNKVAPDYDKALFRARNIAAPQNARRLNRNTPCSKGELRCYNCSSPERICKALTVFWDKPSGCEYEIILIDEELGY